jgi:intein/homing endonuclease
MSLADIALDAGKQKRTGRQVANIIEFVESSWGLDIPLYPVQRVILKAHYGIPLDDNPYGVDLDELIPLDHPHYDEIAHPPPDDEDEEDLPALDAEEMVALGIDALEEGEEAEDYVGYYKYRVKITDWRRDNPRYMTEADYLRMLFKEGRCNIDEVVPGKERRELVLSIGRRSGKCILGDSLVLTDSGVRRIEELGDPDGPEVQPLEVGVAQEGAKQSRSAFFYNGGVKATRTLTTRCGYQLGGTDNHRIKVLTEQGTVEWKYLADMKAGDVVCIHRNTNLWASDYIDCTPFHNGLGYKDLSFPDRLTEDWGRLLGYLVGDGLWNYKGRVEVTVEHDETWETLKDLYTRLLGSYSVVMDKRTENTGSIKFNSVGMRAFLNGLGFRLGTDRDAKMVPWSILQSPRPVVQAFLRGLFETDGGVEKDGKVVSFSTASGRLAREVQTLLLNLGIVSRIRPKTVKGKVYWILTIRGLRHRLAFAERVGFDSEKKMGPLLASVGFATKEGGDAESIPHQRQWCRRLLESVPKGSRHSRGQGRSQLREVLGNTIKPSATDEMTYPRLAELLPVARHQEADPEVLAHFEHLLELDYFFDPVEGIEDGMNPVFDLNVPDGESFVANGMTNHNTFICACVVAYEVYKLILKENPQGYYGIPKANVIQLISVATDKDQAGLLYNEASNHFSNCFAPETEIITSEGVKPLGDLVGTTPTLLTGKGAWVEAPIRSFGEQRLHKLVLTRQGVEKTIFCTADHRWFALDQRKPHRGRGHREFKTTELRPGKHRLQQVYGRSYKNKVKASPFGVAHGFTFGDGSTSQGLRHATSVNLVGEKDSHLLPFFALCPSSEQQGINAVRYSALPNFFREKPSIKENHSYLLGWLMGYFAADGSCQKGGQVVISSSVEANIQFVRDVCAVLGIGTFTIRREDRVSNLTGRPHTMFSMALQRSHLDESFFIIPQHRQNFVDAGGSEAQRRKYWMVKSVEPTNRVEKVFCATVPEVHTFTLDGNIVTGNCAFYKPYTANNTMSYAKFQSPEDIKRFGKYDDDPTAKATIKVSFKSCVAKGLRGAGNIVIILDELAHFNDVGQSDALKIYRAVKPSLASFSPKDPRNKRRVIGKVEGRILSISSPLGKQGFFYRKYRQGFSGGLESLNMLCIQAPTWEVNPTVEATFLAEEYATDPDSFFTEFGADFTDRTRGWLKPHLLFKCIDPLLRPANKAPVRAPHFMGIDISAGLVDGDYCAVAIGHLDDHGNIILDYIERIRAGEGDYEHLERLSFDIITAWLYALSRRFYIEKGLFDQWAGIPFEAALHKRGLTQCESVFFTKTLTSQVFANFKTLLAEGRIKLFSNPGADERPSSHADYIQELLELQAETHSKYIVTVEAPDQPDKFDDYSDAIARMIWEATQHLGKRKYIAGSTRRRGEKASATELAKARRKATSRSRLGGSSPDRQRSLIRGRVRGRGVR